MQRRQLAMCPLILLALAACSGSAPPATPAPGASATDTGTQAEAITRTGDVSIRASAIQTSQLDPSIARQYGIARDPNTILLLVAVRQGPDATATALPATITAAATDLRGGRQDITMRELRAGELVDYVGTVTTTLPDTLRFDVNVVRANGATATMQLSRDFFPR